MPVKSLAIVGVLWNPLQHKRLYENFCHWREHLPNDSSVETWLIEIVRPGTLPQLDLSPQTVRFWLEDHIWCMESARNAVIRQYIRHVEAIVWMDTDLVFTEKKWWQILLKSLEKHPVIQPFKTGIWLDQSGKIQDKRRSLSWAYVHGNMGPWPQRLGTLHPGFAWAARRDLWDKVNPGMPDWLCTGPNDRAMALACTGFQHPTLRGWWKERLSAYTEDLHKWLGSSTLGYAPLDIVHHWHGNLANRYYSERNERLQEIHWPSHCHYNQDGLLAWTPAGRQLHEQWFRDLWRYRENS